MTFHAHLLFSALDSAGLRDLLPDDIVLTFGEDIPQPAGYHVLVDGRPTRERLMASPNLHTLIIPFAGIPETTQTIMRDFPHIAIHNLHHNTVPTAEQAVTLMLAAAKNIVPIDKIFRTLDWTPRYEPDPALILRGKTVLILGYGSIGRHAAQICRAIGMHVIGIKRNPPEGDSPDEIYTADKLHEVLPRANVLMVTAPLTPATRGMIGAAELALLPPNAIVVNVGRARVIEEAAFYNALKEGHLHSAGLDVWYQYPTDKESRTHTAPSEYPFHELPNVIMSPHRAGSFGLDELETARIEHLAGMLNEANNGEPLPNRVDLEAGY